MHYIINITGKKAKEAGSFLENYYKNKGFSVFLDYSVYDALGGTYEKEKSAAVFSLQKINEFKKTDNKSLYISCFGIADLSLGTDLMTKNQIFDLYDAVFYIGDEEKCEYINNWTGHNHLRMTKNTDELTAETDNFIGEPVHFEIEKKFIIKYPDISYLDSLKNAKAVYISQSYIEENGERKRIRKRGIDGDFSYYLTMKKSVGNSFKKIEEEYKITKEEYERLKAFDINNLTIEKTRYCLSENNTYYEIDVYPFWNDKAVMEIELKDENESYVLPKNIEVIQDVSYDKSYSNYNLALIRKNMKKFAVIGRNFVVDWFISATKQFSSLSFEAVYSRNYETGKEYADKYGVKKVYTDICSLANDEEIDFVYIASPNIFHKNQAIALLNAKKHIICEKPAVLSQKDMEEVTECAKKNDCVFMEAIIPSHSPAIIKLKNDIEKIGKIRHVFLNYCQYSSRYDKFKNGIIENAFVSSLGNGSLMDIGIYPVSIMEFLFGLPKKISAQSCFLEKSIDSNGAFIASYDGFLCEVIYSKVSDSVLPSEIQGEKGSVVIEKMSRPFSYTVKLRNGETEEADLKADKEDMYFELADFLSQLDGNRTDEYNIHTKNVLKITDEIRKQVGIKYENT